MLGMSTKSNLDWPQYIYMCIAIDVEHCHCQVYTTTTMAAVAVGSSAQFNVEAVTHVFVPFIFPCIFLLKVVIYNNYKYL